MAEEIISLILNKIDAAKLQDSNDLKEFLADIIQKLFNSGTSSQSTEMIYLTVIDLSKKLNIFDEEELAQLLIMLGICNIENARPDLCVQFCSEAYDKLEQLRDKDFGTLSFLKIRIGSAYFQMNEFDKSMQSQKEALKLAETAGDKIKIAHANNNIGINYLQIENFSEAEKHLNQAYKMRKVELGELNLDTIATKQNLINLVHRNDKKTAIIQLENQISEMEKNRLESSPEYVRGTDNLMIWHCNCGQFEKALFYAEKEILSAEKQYPHFSAQHQMVSQLALCLRQIINHPSVENQTTKQAIEYLEMHSGENIVTKNLRK